MKYLLPLLFIKVPSIVCDMETSQVACMTDKFNVTPERPYFTHPRSGEKVCVIFDPPHLIKCLRNGFMKYTIRVRTYS